MQFWIIIKMLKNAYINPIRCRFWISEIPIKNENFISSTKKNQYTSFFHSVCVHHPLSLAVTILLNEFPLSSILIKKMFAPFIFNQTDRQNEKFILTHLMGRYVISVWNLVQGKSEWQRYIWPKHHRHRINIRTPNTFCCCFFPWTVRSNFIPSYFCHVICEARLHAKSKFNIFLLL